MEYYNLEQDTVRRFVPDDVAGTYCLGWILDDGNFYAGYVGRSDTDLKRRLLQHTYTGAFPAFRFVPAATIYDAYVMECSAYHLTEGMLNRVHPRAPRRLPYKCPVCTKGVNVLLKEASS